MIYVAYHSNCYDGFGAAFAAWQKLGDQGVQYVPMTYEAPLPAMVSGDTLYCLDYSRPRAELDALAQSGVTVRVIDHHQTAANDLAGAPYAMIDQTKSGAVLAWEFFHPSEHVPQLLLHIQDRDLWQFQLLGTAEIHAALCSYPFDFMVWSQFELEALKADGVPLLRYQRTLTEQLVMNPQWIALQGYTVPIVNTSLLFSEVPQKLLERYPNAPLAAYYYDRGTTRQYGLRSRGDVDVAAIAQAYGGGGHKAAAGFTQPNTLQTP